MKKYQLFLDGVSGIGSKTIERLVGVYGNEKNIYELSKKEVQNCSILTEKQKESFLLRREEDALEKRWEEMRQKGIRIVGWGEDAYPAKLRSIPDKPYLLYYQGKLPEEDEPCVAIIGARSCTGYGRSMAEFFAEELSLWGVSIVSGLANGIDGVAQKAALKSGGISYGVLGSGVDICYPASNRELYLQLKAAGGILSEFPPGTKPEARHFPRRNRIISGLADLVLVIEARERSGTGITVSMALEQGREVYAVPGRINDPLSSGCNRLIAEGAGSALNPEAVLKELEGKYVLKKHYRRECEKREGVLREKEKGNNGSLEEEILRIIKKNACGIEEIRKQSSEKSLPNVLAMLSQMELEDKIVCEMGIYRQRG